MLIIHGVAPLPNPTQLPAQIPALAPIVRDLEPVDDGDIHRLRRLRRALPPVIVLRLPADDGDILHLRLPHPRVVALLLPVESEKTRMMTSQETGLLRFRDHHLEARPDVGGHRPRRVDDRIYGIIWACMIVQQQDLPSKVLSSPVGQVVHPLHQPWPQIPLALPRACSLPC